MSIPVVHSETRLALGRSRCRALAAAGRATSTAPRPATFDERAAATALVQRPARTGRCRSRPSPTRRPRSRPSSFIAATSGPVAAAPWPYGDKVRTLSRPPELAGEISRLGEPASAAPAQVQLALALAQTRRGRRPGARQGLLQRVTANQAPEAQQLAPAGTPALPAALRRAAARGRRARQASPSSSGTASAASTSSATASKRCAPSSAASPVPATIRRYRACRRPTAGKPRAPTPGRPSRRPPAGGQRRPRHAAPAVDAADRRGLLSRGRDLGRGGAHPARDRASAAGAQRRAPARARRHCALFDGIRQRHPRCR